MIVCDTGPLVAAAISNDDHHRECVDLLTSLHFAGRKILVPGTVAAEVGDLLARDGGPGAKTQLLESLADGTLSPVDLRPEDYRRAGELVTAYRDRSGVRFRTRLFGKHYSMTVCRMFGRSLPRTTSGSCFSTADR